MNSYEHIDVQKINMEVTISNFRCYALETFSFQRKGLTLIQGPSGKGKSTIFQAIYWCLYGSMQNVKGSYGTETFVEVRFNHLQIKRQKNPEALLVHFKGDEIEGVAAQYIIERFFGTKDMWLMSSYLLQSERNHFLDLSNVEKFSVLRQFVFDDKDDNQDEYVERVDEECSKNKKELSHKTSFYEGRMMSFQDRYKDVADVHIEDVDKWKQELIDIQRDIQLGEHDYHHYQTITSKLKRLYPQRLEQQQQLDRVRSEQSTLPSLEEIKKEKEEYKQFQIWKQQLETYDHELTHLDVIEPTDRPYTQEEIEEAIQSNTIYENEKKICQQYHLEYNPERITTEIHRMKTIVDQQDRYRHASIARQKQKEMIHLKHKIDEMETISPPNFPETYTSSDVEKANHLFERRSHEISQFQVYSSICPLPYDREQLLRWAKEQEQICNSEEQDKRVCAEHVRHAIQEKTKRWKEWEDVPDHEDKRYSEEEIQEAEDWSRIIGNEKQIADRIQVDYKKKTIKKWVDEQEHILSQQSFRVACQQAHSTLSTIDALNTKVASLHDIDRPSPYLSADERTEQKRLHVLFEKEKQIVRTLFPSDHIEYNKQNINDYLSDLTSRIESQASRITIQEQKKIRTQLHEMSEKIKGLEVSTTSHMLKHYTHEDRAKAILENKQYEKEKKWCEEEGIEYNNESVYEYKIRLQQQLDEQPLREKSKQLRQIVKEMKKKTERLSDSSIDELQETLHKLKLGQQSLCCPSCKSALVFQENQLQLLSSLYKKVTEEEIEDIEQQVTIAKEFEQLQSKANDLIQQNVKPKMSEPMTSENMARIHDNIRMVTSFQFPSWVDIHEIDKSIQYQEQKKELDTLKHTYQELEKRKQDIDESIGEPFSQEDMSRMMNEQAVLRQLTFPDPYPMEVIKECERFDECEETKREHKQKLDSCYDSLRVLFPDHDVHMDADLSMIRDAPDPLSVKQYNMLCSDVEQVKQFIFPSETEIQKRNEYHLRQIQRKKKQEWEDQIQPFVHLISTWKERYPHEDVETIPKPLSSKEMKQYTSLMCLIQSFSFPDEPPLEQIRYYLKWKEQHDKRIEIKSKIDSIAVDIQGVDLSLPEPLTEKEKSDMMLTIHVLSQCTFPTYKDVMMMKRYPEWYKNEEKKKQLIQFINEIQNKISAITQPPRSTQECDDLKATIHKLENDMTRLSHWLAVTENEIAELEREESRIHLVDVDVLKDRKQELEKRMMLVREKEKLEKEKESLTSLQQECGSLSKRQGELQELRQLIMDASGSYLQQFVDSCNVTLNEVAAVLFDDPISVQIDLYKRTKKDQLKSQVSLKIKYKGNEFDHPNQLSGGEGDRLSLALVVTFAQCCQFPFLLVDESMASLDGGLRESCTRVLRQFCPNKGILHICHEAVEGHHDVVINV